MTNDLIARMHHDFFSGELNNGNEYSANCVSSGAEVKELVRCLHAARKATGRVPRKLLVCLLGKLYYAHGWGKMPTLPTALKARLRQQFAPVPLHHC